MRDPQEIIRQFSRQDALGILKSLAQEDEGIAARIVEIATVRLSQVDPEEVGLALYEDLELLEVEEVWDRAGPSRHGYVEPYEVAEEMMDEVLKPYLEELGKLQLHVNGADAVFTKIKIKAR